MVMVVIPFLVAAICVAATSFRARQVASDEISLLQEETLEENSSATIESALVVGFAKLVWFGASVLWMSVPLCYFLTSPFYYSSFSGAVLGVSLSAALPLSWHLMFVSLPSAGYLGPLLGLSRGNMSELHRFIAWSTGKKKNISFLPPFFLAFEFSPLFSRICCHPWTWGSNLSAFDWNIFIGAVLTRELSQ